MSVPTGGLVTDIATNSLKIKYPEKYVETMIQEDQVFRPRLSRDLPRGARLGDGYETRFGARLSPSQNIGSVGDGANFPVQKDAIDRQFVFKPAMVAGSFRIGLMTLEVANSDVAAFNGGEMTRRPEEVMGNLGKYLESMMVGTAGDGIRGFVESDGVNTLTIKKPHQLDLIPDNAYISVRIAAGSTVRDSLDLRSVTDRNLDTRTLTYSGADQTAVANDPVYIVTELAQTLTSIFTNGLRAQIDDGTNAQFIHTLDRTAAGNSKLKSIALSNGGELRALTEQLMIRGPHEVKKRFGKMPSTWFWGPGQTERYIDFVAPQRYFPAVGSQRQGKATGYKLEDFHHSAPGVDFDFVESFDCLMREAYALSWDTFFLYSRGGFKWLSGTQNVTLHLLPGDNGATHRAAFGAYLYGIENWGTDFPGASCVVRDLKDIGD